MLLTNTLARFIDVEPLQKDNSILPDVLIAFLSMPLYSAPSFLV